MQVSHAWTQNCCSPAIWYIEGSSKISLYSQKNFCHWGRLFMSFKNIFSSLQDGTETWHLVGGLGDWNAIFDGVLIHFKWSICVLLHVVYYSERFLNNILLTAFARGSWKREIWESIIGKRHNSHYLTNEAGTPFHHRLVWEDIIRFGSVTLICAIWSLVFPEV